jgi:hypothetical protein
VECLGHDLETAAETLRELDRHMPSSDQFGGANGEPVPDQENNEPVYNLETIREPIPRH